MNGYPRFLTRNLTPYDPLELSEQTEKLITRNGPDGLERKYTKFYSVPVYRGIATGYAVGCNLRCVYCWSDWSRDFPEKRGKFYSPKQVAENLFNAAREGLKYSKYWRTTIPTVNKLRLSGCEPTLGKEHLLEVLKHIYNSQYPLFILETNGILFGSDKNYVANLNQFKDKLYVRVSIKAALPEAFTERTGAIGKYYELPFKALNFLLNYGIDSRAAAMTDPKIMSHEERKILIQKLDEINPNANYGNSLEEEILNWYSTTKQRLKAYDDYEYANKIRKRIIGSK
jgi:uncharacterized Fe-S cluster-containing radical SAM superfamily protein